MLKILNLWAMVDQNMILKGVNLEIAKGQKHVIMGPNGSGKSTLVKVIAGHPDYEITKGEILYEGQDITEMEPDERAALGIFMAFQYPVEIPGVDNKTFLLHAYNALAKARGKEEKDPIEMEDLLFQHLPNVGLKPSFLERNVNMGFSGGEKKKNEIFQLTVLQPTLALLDETDSGLDIDALKIVGKGINDFVQPCNATLIVTHYQRLLNYVTPDFVHVMKGGKIIKSGTANLAAILDEEGYEKIN